jgi:hypothetical protein
MKKDTGAIVEGALKWAVFEWTTYWGLRPERALFILAGGIGVFSLFYFMRDVTPGGGRSFRFRVAVLGQGLIIPVREGCR